MMTDGSWYEDSALRAVSVVGLWLDREHVPPPEGTGSAAGADSCHVGMWVQNRWIF